jgi:diaminopropionate ammonia-lyase
MPSAFLRTTEKAVAAGASPTRDAQRFHASLPGYEPTRLVDCPALAGRLGIASVLAKDESARLGLPAFKVLGVTWAVFRALGRELSPPAAGFSELIDRRGELGSKTLVAATDGNHGRAVARVARLLGLGARIYVPGATASATIEAIRSEGADVRVVDGVYDEAVARSREDAGDDFLVVSDTAWPGYSEIPLAVIEGYGTLFWEIDDELERRGDDVDLVLVQMGVGALAAAAGRHFRRPGRRSSPALVGVEPATAACVLESMVAGEPVSVPGHDASVMVGLNCGTPSPVAWPTVSTTIDLYLSIEDEPALRGMRLLAEEGIAAGETGAAGVGGLIELMSGDGLAAERDALGLGPETRALVIVTEGPTPAG